MGYYVKQVDHDFFIPAESIPSLILAIRKQSDYGGYNRVLDRYMDSDDIQEIFRCWRWLADMDNHGNIVGLRFNCEQLIDDKVLIKAIAPFVRDGSYLQFIGQDDVMWRWKFINGELKTICPKIIWEDGPLNKDETHYLGRWWNNPPKPPQLPIS
jgi:hypothetical protein